MTPAVIFPDASLVLVGHLRAELAARGVTAPIGTRVPNPRPATFVTVERTGGPRRDVVTDEPQLTVDCWAPTEKAAHDLAQLCRGLTHSMRGRSVAGVAVYRVTEFAGPQLLPDPDSEHPRYTQTLQIAMRGAAA